jgi:EAL domain
MAPRNGSPQAVDALARGLTRDMARSVVYRPVLNVARGIAAGFEATSGTQSRAIQPANLTSALHSAVTLPRNTFLLVPLDVRAGVEAAVRAALLRLTSLAGIVFYLLLPECEPTPDTVTTTVRDIRSAGGVIALAGPRSPPESPESPQSPQSPALDELRPEIVRLDSTWIRDIDQCAAKRAALRRVGGLASERDAWILVDGVQTKSELATLAELGVPLATGPLIGCVAKGWPAINPSAVSALPRPPAGMSVELLARLRHAPTALLRDDAWTILRARTDLEHVVIVDLHRRPSELVSLDRQGQLVTHGVLKVNLGTELAEVITRAGARLEATRDDPVAVTDNAGRLLGLVDILPD